MSSRAFYLTETQPLPRPTREWLLARLDETWPETPVLELDGQLDTTFEQVVLVVAGTLAAGIVLSAVSGLLGFLLGLFVAA